MLIINRVSIFNLDSFLLNASFWKSICYIMLCEFVLNTWLSSLLGDMLQTADVNTGLLLHQVISGQNFHKAT